MKTFCFLLVSFIYFGQAVGQHRCEKEFWKTYFITGNAPVNVLLIWFPTNVGVETTLRVCSEKTGLPLQRHCSYDRDHDRLSQTGVWEQIEKVKLINCTSIESFCMEETFEHKYTYKNAQTETFFNKWKTTKMGERGELQEPCLIGDGVPYTRHCQYNRVTHRAQWDPLSPDSKNMNCTRDEKLIIYDLNILYQQAQNDSAENTLNVKQVAKNMTELLVTSQSVRIPADIKTTTEILKIITENEKNPQLLNDVLNITDIIMAGNETTIVTSDKVDAPSDFLQTIDNYFHSIAEVIVPADKCHIIPDGIAYDVVNLTSVFYINPFCSNVTGLAIYKTKSREEQQFDPNTGNYFNFIYMNRTLDYIKNASDLLLASYFPLSLWDKMKNHLGAVTNNTVLTFIVFKNDKIFINRTKSYGRPLTNILEITISNYTRQLPEDLPFIYGFSKSNILMENLPKCGYWNNRNWSTINITTKHETFENTHHLICQSSHLTHLGAIFGISFKENFMLSMSHNLMLEYISILGSGISLLGLSSIWLTAICFKSFRVNPSNKVLLNMSFVLTLLMLFLILSNMLEDHKTSVFENSNILCKIKGAFLHYIVSVLNFWMLIIAVTQYLRYVKVIGYVMPSHFILKSSILAWGLPLISVFYVDSEGGYTIKSEFSNICYPTGNILQYGVILPMSVVLSANLCVFVCILYSLRRSLVQFEHHSRKYIKYQVRVSLLLFFLLGISWLFGIMSFLYKSHIFGYLFCLLSTLQGFVLFLFFIIFDEQTRLSWTIFCCAKSYKTREGKNLPKYINMNSL